MLDGAMVDKFVDKNSSSVSVVENERVPQRFSSDVVGLFALQ